MRVVTTLPQQNSHVALVKGLLQLQPCPQPVHVHAHLPGLPDAFLHPALRHVKLQVSLHAPVLLWPSASISLTLT